MKKYQLGALKISDRGLQDTKEEIVVELIDRMQKYVAEAKAAYENENYTDKQKMHAIELYCGKFCGLSDFMQNAMGIDARREDGLLYTQEMYTRFFYWKQMLNIAIAKDCRK